MDVYLLSNPLFSGGRGSKWQFSPETSERLQHRYVTFTRRTKSVDFSNLRCIMTLQKRENDSQTGILYAAVLMERNEIHFLFQHYLFFRLSSLNTVQYASAVCKLLYFSRLKCPTLAVDFQTIFNINDSQSIIFSVIFGIKKKQFFFSVTTYRVPKIKNNK